MPTGYASAPLFSFPVVVHARSARDVAPVTPREKQISGKKKTQLCTASASLGRCFFFSFLRVQTGDSRDRLFLWSPVWDLAKGRVLFSRPLCGRTRPDRRSRSGVRSTATRGTCKVPMTSFLSWPRRRTIKTHQPKTQMSGATTIQTALGREKKATGSLSSSPTPVGGAAWRGGRMTQGRDWPNLHVCKANPEPVHFMTPVWFAFFCLSLSIFIWGGGRVSIPFPFLSSCTRKRHNKKPAVALTRADREMQLDGRRERERERGEKKNTKYRGGA